ncbi:MAG: RnfABCDGE type electron transport complex subunit G [Bacteroidales bacterium]
MLNPQDLVSNMARKASTLTSMLITLTLVCVVSAGVLGVVNELTKEPISISKNNKKLEALQNVLPENDHIGKTDSIILDGAKYPIEITRAYGADNEVIGVAIQSFSNNGFSGLIQVMVGFTPDGNIYNYEVLSHNETPGLGSKMLDWFKDSSKNERNIVGKNPKNINLTVAKDGGDVDAITASTITSRAFLEAVEQAYKSIEIKENR